MREDRGILRVIATTLWTRNSPNWRFDEATLNAHASAFDA
jgi:hypothetical protein